MVVDEAGQLDRRRRAVKRRLDHRSGQQNSAIVAPATTSGDQELGVSIGGIGHTDVFEHLERMLDDAVAVGVRQRP